MCICRGVLPFALIAGTKEETAYPRPLAACIARCFCLSALRSGAVPPAESLGDLQLSPQQVLLALRAEWGTQPKASRLPPLVPEHRAVVAVSGPMQLLPQVFSLSASRMLPAKQKASS